ncbi:hypothetical protein Cni_G02745 [Canna indica]|uniref:TRF2/HOY1 PH-like domain-containing protein n=1 Tax=Canna indica TaxID=4628 RepID=A0AAQ3Q0M6_9LILI|nr:hypothetical protein Cni_G02745 [Canna indica]
MVRFPDSHKFRARSCASPKAAVQLEIEDALEDERGPFFKRSKTTISQEQGAVHSMLDGPSPLGLRLRKSPSLVDLIQMRLSQANSSSASCGSSFASSEERKKQELKLAVVSSAAEKMKASNFPLSLLRIGSWQCVSKYEGDLVAKCYFAKHKLVWEVLEGGLKSKIEIQWPDIIALKATCPDKEHGTLDIVLSRPPLFFRETDPQPRKHTLWQPTQDFTGGQASIHRRHFLKCSHGFLSKNFEKIIQCDLRLKSLSQQPGTILDPPHFESHYSVFEDSDASNCDGLNSRKVDYEPTFSRFSESTSLAVNSSMSNKSDLEDSAEGAQAAASRDTPSPCSGCPSQTTEEYTCKEGGRNTDQWNQLKLPNIWGSTSMDDLVNCFGHHISEHINSGNQSSTLSNKEISEDLTQFCVASDECSPLSRVGSFLQADKRTDTTQNPFINDGDEWQLDTGSRDEPCTLYDELVDRKPIISRKESFAELLMLPRIASMPQFLFNISDVKNEEG